MAAWIEAGLTAFTRTHGATLDAIKNAAMFYALLPVRIGLDGAVLPFTWGVQWTASMSLAFYAAAAALAVILSLRGRVVAGLSLLILAGILETCPGPSCWPAREPWAGQLAAGGWRALAC